MLNHKWNKGSQKASYIHGYGTLGTFSENTHTHTYAYTHTHAHGEKSIRRWCNHIYKKRTLVSVEVALIEMLPR